MSGDAGGTEPADDIRRQLREATARPLMTPALRRRKLMLWVFRQVVLVLLAWWFWEHAWMRWAFGIGVAFAAINLFLILFAQRLLDARMRRAEQRIDHLERTLRGADGHNAAGD